MDRKSGLFAVALISMVLFAALSREVYAQTSRAITINAIEAVPQSDHLRLNVYFSLLDSDGRVVQDADIEQATVLLDDGTRYEALRVEQPDEPPLHIVLVLDASGSMGGQVPEMQRAAIQAVESAPVGSRIAVIQFNDQINVLQDFTTSTSRVVNAISQVQSTYQAGTCLYDAAYESVLLLRDAPEGRRAVILFTDGTDTTLQGTVCSTHSIEDVVEMASQSDLPVFVNTVGLRTRDLNEFELRRIAELTGGVSAIGGSGDLDTLFQSIMDVLTSQWLATFDVYPSAGEHSATLQIVQRGGGLAQPDVALFTASQGYERPVETPVATTSQSVLAPDVPTETPVPIVGVDTITVSLPNNTVSVRAITSGVESVFEYRFDFRNAYNNTEASYAVPAPLFGEQSFPLEKISDGEHTVTITGFAVDGTIVARSQSEPFVIVRPTPTPEPTAETASVRIDAMSWLNQDARSLQIDLLLSQRAEIASIRVAVTDSNGIEVRSFRMATEDTIELDLSGLPAGSYQIIIDARSSNSVTLSTAERELSLPELPTPTPEPVAIARIAAVTPETEQFIVILETDNEELIQKFVLDVFNEETNVLVNSVEHVPPPHSEIRIDLSAISSGTHPYTLRLRGFDAENNEICRSVVNNVTITKPADPSALTQFVNSIKGEGNKNLPYMIVGGVGVLVLLVVLLVFLIRRGGKSTMSQNVIQELTDFGEVSDLPPDYIPAYGSNDPEVTNPVPRAIVPEAFLVVERSREKSLQGNRILIDPAGQDGFKLGRRGKGDVNFDGDDNVSRNHATISFDNNVFFITDQGSTIGTFLDDRRLSPRVPEPLYSGIHIRLGATTVLRFEQSDAVFDPDKTNPQPYVPLDPDTDMTNRDKSMFSDSE